MNDESFSDFNIEIAHVEFTEEFQLANESLLCDARLSAKLAKQVTSLLRKKGHSVSVSILIDDKRYTTERQSRHREKFSSYSMIGQGAVQRLLSTINKELQIDYIVFESELRQFRDLLFAELIPNKHTRRYAREAKKYEETTGNLPCYLDIAIWHLLRLGCFTQDMQITPKLAFPVGALGCKTEELPLPAFVARQVISVLHDDPDEAIQEKRFSFHERRAIRRLLRHLPGENRHLLTKISRIYFSCDTNDVSTARFDETELGKRLNQLIEGRA
jgi:hypothetical protein